MTARSSTRRPFAWTEKEFHEDVLPDKRRLAAALQRICRRLVIKSPDGEVLGSPTQAQAAEYLRVSETSLTRYLQGRYVPAAEVVVSIFDTACQDAGGEQNLGITRDELLERHARAEQERCANCARHREAVRAAGQKLRALQKTQEGLERAAEEKARELRELRQRASALKQEAQKTQAAQPGPEAGLRKGREAARAATLLPVPPSAGDRQQREKAPAAAPGIIRRAEELVAGGRPDSVLALLRHTAEAYTPTEIALLVAVLRTRGQDDLAGNLVHIYGRDRSDRDIVRTALVLHEHHAVTDAEALLRAAAGRPTAALI
jgi:transcriptional regulator with XRE-family HTH domain